MTSPRRPSLGYRVATLFAVASSGFAFAACNDLPTSVPDPVQPSFIINGSDEGGGLLKHSVARVRVLVPYVGAPNECTGTLVSPYLLLTAAHCVDRVIPPSSQRPHSRVLAPFTRGAVWVYFGRKRYEPTASHRAIAYATIWKGTSVEDSSTRSTRSDLVLLWLDEAVSPDVAKPRAVLTSPPEPPFDYFQGLGPSAFRIAGWGDVGPGVEATIRQTVRATFLDFGSPYRANQIRVDPDGDAQVYFRDSGAPLLLAVGNEEVLTGVMHGGFLNVAHFVPTWADGRHPFNHGWTFIPRTDPDVAAWLDFWLAGWGQTR